MRIVSLLALWSTPALAIQTQPSLVETQRGSCLDAAWVHATATKYNLDPNARDGQNRRLNPLLQPGLKNPRFKFTDRRMNNPNIFSSCLQSGEAIHGLGEQVYPNGSQAYAGIYNGTVILELNPWTSHDLSRLVITILLQEVVGYGVSSFETGGGLHCAERMSGEGLGRCSPTHVNPEVWTSGKLSTLKVYANETAPVATGFNGITSLYTLTANVEEGLKGKASTKGNFSQSYSLDFWRDYLKDDVINYYSFKNAPNVTKFFTSAYCADNTMGCMNGCSRSYACTVAEAAGKNCLLIAFMTASLDPGYFQAMVANNNIPAYFCFAGYDGMTQYILNTINSGGSIIFYQFEPDTFFYQHPGKFAKIAFPRSDPANVALASGTFGEKGYGQNTTNQVSTDYPQIPIMRYMSKVVTTDPFLSSFLNRAQVTQLDINNIFSEYTALSTNTNIVDPEFTAACNWVKNNYLVWSNWVDKLPLCTMQDNIKYSYQGCNSSLRVVTFVWNTPSPSNASLPYDCEGGIIATPPPYSTSKSCDWLDSNTKTWMNWLSNPPLCDSSFYNYMITDCTSGSIRNVLFFWLLPNPTNYAQSSECTGGVSLPANSTIDCDYVPTNSGTFSGITAFSVVVIILLVVSLVLVIVFREKPVIKRSQWHLLVVLILGGIFMCIYVILGGGAPSNSLCAARPIFASVGYTLAFGSLLLKSLRVYLVFHNKALKKNVVTITRMLHILMGFIGIDVVIIGVWYAVDFPGPSTYISNAATFSGKIDHIECHSSSFIFPVLCIFWKAIITFFGLYVSFLIRHDDGDFQESIWIFSASCVVLMGALFMLPLAYLVELPAATSFAFCSAVTLVCTIMVMALMLVPKFARLNRADYKTSTSGTTAGTKNTAKSTTRQATTSHEQIALKSQVSPRDTTSVH
ncbi:hypothetical protein THRCLA_07569 [Thraustotheca clavata]|uniref:G-protein coupled receptors family 3 profile domain-containing protein n=1 Tax=Thraustotheca clavata TaxID=74557 RepID=A0A1V9ZD65_9STRA|nr:hypothetical protein THRCLA_07569 [Thraustotheca clavata]